MEVLELLANHELSIPLDTFHDSTCNVVEGPAVPTVPAPLRQHQTRLVPAQVDELVKQYQAGSSIDGLAREFRVNRTTVISHLDKRSVERRRNPRKMTDTQVQEAAALRAEGATLVVLAQQFGVVPRTLSREFKKFGVER